MFTFKEWIYLTIILIKKKKKTKIFVKNISAYILLL